MHCGNLLAVERGGTPQTETAMTVPKPLRLLWLADTPEQASALAQQTASAQPGAVEWTTAHSREDFFRLLRQPWDAVVSTVRPGGFAPFESIGAVAEAQPYLPVLCVGKSGVDEISEALKCGAMDFVEHLRDLPERVRAAIQKMRARRSGDESAAALRTSETMFRALSERALAGVYLIREDHRFAYVNPRLAELFGYSVEEILKEKSVEDLVLAEDRDLVIGNLKRRLSGEVPSLNYTFRGVRKDGTVFDVEVFGNRTEFDGRPAVVGTLLDVSERQQARRRIEHLNRTLSVLSAINQTIVRERDPRVMMETACRTAVEKGGFRLAWVGMLDAASGTVRPAAWAGAEDGYVGEIEIATAASSPQGCGPTAEALRTGLHAVCNDIANDPRMTPWRDAALRRGFRSSAAFPLKVNGQSVGAFNLYAAEADFFTEEELLLLDELAADIGFSLEVHQREQERHTAEQALKESEARFRQLTENIREVFWLTDVEKNSILYVSPAYEKVWGRSCQSLYENPRDWLAAIHPEDRERVLQAALTRQPTDEYDEEYRIVRPDGAVRWIHDVAFPVRDESGRVVRIAGVAEDITQRKEAEMRALRLAAFPELNPNPVLELATDGSLVYQNKAALTLSQSLGCPDFKCLLPAETPQIVRQCLATGQPRLRLETSHGNRTLSWSFYPIRDSNTVHCYVGDITERLKLEEQFRQAQKMEAIGQLAGGVAHDFNNILAALMMQTSLLQAKESLDEETRQGLDEIARSAERAASLTRQLLMFSRRQAKQARPLDMAELVGGMTKFLRRILGEDIALESRFASELPLVHADPGMMEQVLMNLAVNARDAMMPQGGKLLLVLESVSLDGSQALSHSEARPGRFVRLSVADTGCGIAPEHLPHIFEPFYTTKEVGKGTGLGLATVHGIVKQHEGWIEVDSTPGRGTTFHIYLPAVEQKAGEAPIETAPPVRGGTETILLVEDEAAVRDLARLVLERYGYTVLIAENGPAALEVWRQNKGRIDLVLTDLVMPGGLSGRALAAQLQAERPGLKVIFTSGYSDEIVSRHLDLQSGCNFLQKPYPPRDLAETVRNCLDSGVKSRGDTRFFKL
jgi:two-component system cell cycle sensor histidine kinase/response regulator CckA